MTSTNLWQNDKYIIELPYINSCFITEYDIAQANINVLRSREVIDSNTHDWLRSINKYDREVFVGNMIRNDSTVWTNINQGIKDARELFFKENNIKDNEVLSIKNDAIFILGSRPLKTIFGEYIEFKKKNVYTFYMRTTSKLEILYNYNPINGIETIDVKGINDEKLSYHSNFMIMYMCQIFHSIQNEPIEDTLKLSNEYIENYIYKRLNVEFYREFDPYCKFRINNKGTAFLLDFINQKDLNDIDINCNLMIMRDIHTIIMDIYFQKMSKIDRNKQNYRNKKWRK